MRVIDAANLMFHVYYKNKAEPGDVSIDLKHVQAHFKAKYSTLVIEGTNEPADWFLFNMNLLISPDPTQGDSGAWYHAGFYNHAQLVFSFAKPLADRIKLVVGHSLGAASAQIVGPSLKKRTLAFAAPKPFLRGKPIRPKLVTVINREDDFVCRLPGGLFNGALGYGHVGEVNWIRPSGVHFGEDHRIDKYIDLLEDDGPFASLGEREIDPDLPTFPTP